MALERDNQHIEAVRHVGSYTLTESVETVCAAVDTYRMRSLAFVIVPSGALDPGDEILLSAEDSPDNVTFTDVNPFKLLPSEKQTDQTVVDALGGWLQTLGVISAERYVRLVINPDVMAQTINIDVWAIMHPENLAFRDWDPAAMAGDGMP